MPDKGLLGHLRLPVGRLRNHIGEFIALSRYHLDRYEQGIRQDVSVVEENMTCLTSIDDLIVAQREFVIRRLTEQKESSFHVVSSKSLKESWVRKLPGCLRLLTPYQPYFA